METTPYFKNSNTQIQQLTVNEILAYLRKFDANLNGDNLLQTFINVKTAFTNYSAEDIKLLRLPGQGIVVDGYLKTATIADGFRAINRRGFYQLSDDFNVVDIPNMNNGKFTKTIQASALYTEGKGKKIYADRLNVGPLVNQFAFGFDFSNYSQPRRITGLLDFDQKIAYLKTITNKVIYILEQYTLKDDEYKAKYQYYPKHTVWLILPNSLFLFINSLAQPVESTERLMLVRADESA